ncbi:hypothetical protein H0H81_009796 [Sphagnurus paluster]|uniref:Uncharacterized protein n=1 Tax=Sphagnurus paluster TaxID=117069 RepID=A0A9P7FYU4_9AGAR|nr:hypothetical protein H0H81_009796 [Sphagnurus paluster]
MKKVNIEASVFSCRWSLSFGFTVPGDCIDVLRSLFLLSPEGKGEDGEREGEGAGGAFLFEDTSFDPFEAAVHSPKPVAEGELRKTASLVASAKIGLKENLINIDQSIPSCKQRKMNAAYSLSREEEVFEEKVAEPAATPMLKTAEKPSKWWNWCAQLQSVESALNAWGRPGKGRLEDDEGEGAEAHASRPALRGVRH